MELQQIRYFLAVVREGNFSRAATACHVTQPSLTRAIRKLEASVGGQLFDRRPGGPELTDLGASLMPRLERAWGELAGALDQAQGHRFEQRRRLRIGITRGLGPGQFEETLARLASIAPDHEMAITELPSHDIVDRLMEGEIDAGLGGLPTYPDEIAAKPLFRERYIVAFASSHRFSEETSVGMEELASEVLVSHAASGLDEVYAASSGDRAFPLHARHRLDREDWVQRLVLSGAGVALLAEHVELINGLQSRPLVEPELTREIALLTVRGRPRSPLADAFVRLLSAHKWKER